MSPADFGVFVAAGIIAAAASCSSCSGAPAACVAPVTPGIDNALAQCLTAPGGAYDACSAQVAAAYGTSVDDVGAVWSGHVAAEIREGFVPRQYPAAPAADGGH